MDMILDIYPLTIISDRYGGTYSGGQYLAFNLYADLIPVEVDSTDMICGQYWAWHESGNLNILIGKGSTPNEAAYDLYIKMQKA